MDGTITAVGGLDGRYLLVEFQDCNGNVCYFHTDARVTWLPDGTSVAAFITNQATDEDIDAAMIN